MRAWTSIARWHDLGADADNSAYIFTGLSDGLGQVIERDDGAVTGLVFPGKAGAMMSAGRPRVPLGWSGLADDRMDGPTIPTSLYIVDLPAKSSQFGLARPISRAASYSYPSGRILLGKLLWGTLLSSNPNLLGWTQVGLPRAFGFFVSIESVN